ncbi:MAG: rhomboid family intramembrane serine protease [Pirellulaceae bacterium]
MGLYDRSYYREEESGSFLFSGSSGRSMVTTLIIINAAVFIADALFAKQLNGQLVSSVSEFLLVRPDTLRTPWYWWRLLTAGFTHDPSNIWHVVGNMFMLFVFGRDVEGSLGKSRFCGFYLTAIVLGNLGWCLRQEVFGYTASGLLGASGAVSAVVILFAMMFPNRTVLFMMFLPMKAWVLGVLYVVFDAVSAFGASGNVANDVHLIGAAYGFLYYRHAWDLSFLLPANWSQFKWPWRRTKLKIHDPDAKIRKLDEQADQILQKLHRDGESSLSKKERKILEEYSRRMQQKLR